MMKTIIVERTDGKDIKFIGECIAAASSSDERAHPSYSGSVGRSTALKLFVTQGGKYICQRIERTRWQGERNRYEGAVCNSHEEVIVFFGDGWLAKEIYDDAEIDSAMMID